MTFRTEFDLTGFDPATAAIDGRLMSDDWIVESRLNGKKLPLSTHDWGRWRPVRIGEGFVAGKNALEMVVENLPGGGSPMGLCVQWKGVGARREAGGRKMMPSGGS